MEKTISAADANRKFSEVLREVRQGRSYVVTSHGRPVARICPIVENTGALRARAALLKRVRAQPVRNVARWKREELYED